MPTPNMVHELVTPSCGALIGEVRSGQNQKKF